ncbi:hypothetical protein EJB05_47859, partial [Eragrostis curvula]
MRTVLLFIVVALVSYVVVAPATAIPAPPLVPAGAFSPIQNVNDPHIVDLGRWAVAQHNKQTNSGLTFNSVVGGEQQVVAGMRYHLFIDASNPNGRVAKRYVYPDLLDYSDGEVDEDNDYFYEDVRSVCGFDVYSYKERLWFYPRTRELSSDEMDWRRLEEIGYI